MIVVDATQRPLQDEAAREGKGYGDWAINGGMKLNGKDQHGDKALAAGQGRHSHFIDIK